jgi:hypothetical protein
MKTSKLTVVVVFCALAAWINNAGASYMTYEGLGLKSNVKLHAAGTLADGLTIPAGQLKVRLEGTEYLGYCVDLNQYAGSGDVTVLGLDSLRNGDLVGYLYDTYAQDVDTGLEAAALGVAIWEVLYETSGAFNAGDGYLWISNNADVLAQANVLLEALPDHFIADDYIRVLNSPRVQDVVVPEPTTIAVLGLGGAGFLLRRKFRGGNV